MSFDPLDPRITAYVFGELSSEERQAFESELSASSELQEAVQAIRETARQLTDELAQESGTCLSVAQRDAVHAAIADRSQANPAKPAASHADAGPGTGSQRWLFAVLALAAMLLIAVAFAQYDSWAVRQRAAQNREVALNPSTETVTMSELSREEASNKRAERALGDLQPPGGQSAAKDDLSAGPHSLAKKGLEEENRAAATERQRLERQASHPGQVSGGDTGQAASSRLATISLPTPAPSSGSKPADPLGNRAPAYGGGPQTSRPAVTRYDSLDVSGPGLASTPRRQPAPDANGYGGGYGDEYGSGYGVDLDYGYGGMSGYGGGEGYEAESKAADNESLRQDSRMGMGSAGDRYAPIVENAFQNVLSQPLSTFSIDVDTASYSKVRMYLLQHNQLPRSDAVRIEELVNYFTYDYAPPEDETPFAAHIEIAECPWQPEHRLVRFGIKGQEMDRDERPTSNLVFLLDVSGSMNQPNKLPLVKHGMKMLVDQLGENDRVAMVVYAGAAGLVLDSTCGDEKSVILGALDRLNAGGSTNGGQGIRLAYQMALDNFVTGGVNRVILCTDGDFNVGVTGTDELVKIAEDNAKTGVFLSVLGFGMGNHNDSMLEQISNKGNGNYAFIDNEAEAHKVLVEEIAGTLVTIAKDVKIQVEFNPEQVQSYRLIGYENRMLAAEDFNDDTKDAGEIGAGHTVTALYEVVPGKAVSAVAPPPVDELRYQRASELTAAARSGELLTLNVRYKQPDGDKSSLLTFPVKDAGHRFGQASKDFRFAASVAAFGMLLRNSQYRGEMAWAGLQEVATEAASGDASGYRAEFLEMVAQAKSLCGQ